MSDISNTIEFKDIKDYKGRIVLNEIEKILIDHDVINIFKTEVEYFETHKALYSSKLLKDNSAIWRVSNKKSIELGHKDELIISITNNGYDIKIEKFIKAKNFQSSKHVNIDINMKYDNNKLITIKEEITSTSFEIFKNANSNNHSIKIIKKELDKKNNELNYETAYVEENIHSPEDRSYFANVSVYEEQNQRFIICYFQNSDEKTYLIKKEANEVPLLYSKDYLEDALKDYEKNSYDNNWLVMSKRECKSFKNSNDSISNIYDFQNNQSVNKVMKKADVSIHHLLNNK